MRDAEATIAAEEAEHAELAWRTIRWAIATGGRPVADAVAAAFADAPRLMVPAQNLHCPDHGLLSSNAIAAIMQRGYDELVVPCARALLTA